MMAGDWSAAREANALALENARRLVATDGAVLEWRTDCLLPARWMEIAVAVAAGRREAAQGLIARFRKDFTWNGGTKSADERFAWIMIDMLDGMELRAAGNEPAARARLQQAAQYLPAEPRLMDARLMGAAKYLQRTTRETGLPASAPADAGRNAYCNFASEITSDHKKERDYYSIFPIDKSSFVIIQNCKNGDGRQERS